MATAADAGHMANSCSVGRGVESTLESVGRRNAVVHTVQVVPVQSTVGFARCSPQTCCSTGRDLSLWRRCITNGSIARLNKVLEFELNTSSFWIPLFPCTVVVPNLEADPQSVILTSTRLKTFILWGGAYTVGRFHPDTCYHSPAVWGLYFNVQASESYSNSIKHTVQSL